MSRHIPDTVLTGCWLQVDWLLATEPPAVLQALAQIVAPQKLLEAIGGRSGTGRVSRTAGHLALRLLNFHKNGTVFEDPHITGGFRDDNGNSLCHRGNASRRHVA